MTDEASEIISRVGHVEEIQHWIAEPAYRKDIIVMVRREARWHCTAISSMVYKRSGGKLCFFQEV